ncbi:MAG: DUF58 domain-containing protein [Eubacteriales bacterium]|nr:DUF58 domain-containing protein [Eubacteriales bacterium]
MKKRRISAILLFLAGILMSSYYSGRVLFLFLFFWFGIHIIAFVYFKMLPTTLPCSLELPTTCAKGKRITGYLHIVQDGKLPIFHGKARIRFKSLYYKQEDTITMDITLMGNEEGIAAFYLDLPYVGLMEIILEEAEIYGLFGMWKKTILSSLKKQLMIMPDTRDIHMNFMDLGRLDPEGDEIRDARYGFDPGMYQGIRPYRDGDSMKYIHWKLTGKTGEMMVKELGIPSGREPRLYLETGLPDLDPSRIDQIIEDYFSFSMALLSHGYPHILCWKSAGESMEEYRVENMVMLEEQMESLFRVEFWENVEADHLDTWIYYMSHDETEVYGFYSEDGYDYVERVTAGVRLWNEGRK